MSHTPGPWKHDKERHAIVSTTWWECKDVDGLDDIPASIVNLYGAMGGDDTAADARLIAAAPEMLEALKEIAKGKGAYSLDQFEHARNTIENMKSIAFIAIAIAEAGE